MRLQDKPVSGSLHPIPAGAEGKEPGADGTSTPNDWILGLAKKYGLPLMAREGKSSLAADWNFAYAQAQTPFVTLAHQDDVYGASYTWRIKNAAGKADRPLLLFTDYGELRAGKTESVNSFLRIKRLLLFPLRNQRIQKQIWVRRRILSLGNPICCPAVTYGKERLPGEPFPGGLFQQHRLGGMGENLPFTRKLCVYSPCVYGPPDPRGIRHHQDH